MSGFAGSVLALIASLLVILDRTMVTQGTVAAVQVVLQSAGAEPADAGYLQSFVSSERAELARRIRAAGDVAVTDAIARAELQPLLMSVQRVWGAAAAAQGGGVDDFIRRLVVAILGRTAAARRLAPFIAMPGFFVGGDWPVEQAWPAVQLAADDPYMVSDAEGELALDADPLPAAGGEPRAVHFAAAAGPDVIALDGDDDDDDPADADAVAPGAGPAEAVGAVAGPAHEIAARGVRQTVVDTWFGLLESPTTMLASGLLSLVAPSLSAPRVTAVALVTFLTAS